MSGVVSQFVGGDCASIVRDYIYDFGKIKSTRYEIQRYIYIRDMDELHDLSYHDIGQRLLKSKYLNEFDMKEDNYDIPHRVVNVYAYFILFKYLDLTQEFENINYLPSDDLDNIIYMLDEINIEETYDQYPSIWDVYRFHKQYTQHLYEEKLNPYWRRQHISGKRGRIDFPYRSCQTPLMNRQLRREYLLFKKRVASRRKQRRKHTNAKRY